MPSFYDCTHLDLLLMDSFALQLRHTLQTLLIEQAEREREDARNKVMGDCARLGQFVFERYFFLSINFSREMLRQLSIPILTMHVLLGTAH